MVDAEIGEIDAAATAQQTPELSLAELTQVWTLGVGSDRTLGGMANPTALTISHSSSRIG